MSARLKLGVFGVGSLGQHHARIYAATEGVELVGVHDLDPARAAAVAGRCGTRAFEKAAALAEAVEAASVAVPTDAHYPLAMDLMDRGLHLLVEKPIAATTEEAEAMVDLARARQIILQVGHVERFNPVMRFLEAHLARPRFIEAIRLATYPPPRPGAAPRGTEVSVILDLMIHDLDIILHLVGSPAAEIRAVGVPVLSPSEDIANARILFANGCVANVTASRISQEQMRKIRVFQEDTYVSLDYRAQAGQLMRRTPSGIRTEAVPIEKSEPLAAELASFVGCVRQRRDPVVTARHASEALKLAVDIRRVVATRPS
ncbi:MAG: Gfo/Idh/MocA family oxidoreductase [Lentisphaerae bacterium]|nr:Gfo/Idh/MocA family oxidoreductase [Lentisphaerota bacterium]